MKRTRLILLFVFLLTSIGYAQDEMLDLYTKAMKNSREAKPKEAIELLQRIIDERPDHHIADDALFQIGNISENSLGNYEIAQEVYRRVMTEYPKSKHARRARKRYEHLIQARASGDEPLRLFTRVRQEYPRLGSEKALELALKLYTEYPDFNARDQLIYWIADEYRRVGERYSEAIRFYQELIDQFPKSRWAYFALEKQGQVYIELRDFNEAIATFRKLADYEDQYKGAAKLSEKHIGTAKRFKFLRMLFFACLIITVGAFAFWLIRIRWSAIGRKEILGALIDTAIVTSGILLILLSVIGRPTIFPMTILYLFFVAAAAAFCNHLYISTNKFGKLKRALLLFALFGVAGAIVYVVFYQTDLVNLLYDSLQYSFRKG